MGVIKRPDSVKLAKLEDVDTPVEEVICIIEQTNDSNTVEIICASKESIADEPAEKAKAIIAYSALEEQFSAWVPRLSSLGTIDIDIRNAFYTKTGKLVTCTFDIEVINIVGGKKDSPVTISGLPFTSIGASGSIAGSAFISYFKVSSYSVRQVTGTINGNSVDVDLWCNSCESNSLAKLTQIDIGINTVLVGTVTYISNS